VFPEKSDYGLVGDVRPLPPLLPSSEHCVVFGVLRVRAIDLQIRTAIFLIEIRVLVWNLVTIFEKSGAFANLRAICTITCYVANLVYFFNCRVGLLRQ